MKVMYRSTRDNSLNLTASQAILKGLSEDGGLFVPDNLPPFDKSMEEFSRMDYQTIAYEVMKLLLGDFTEEELKSCIRNAYGSGFDTELLAPLHHVGNASYLELFHGPTIAFKDMALQILPHLLVTSARKNDVKDEIVILTATSGDTGKAAMEGFADVEGTRIVVFYPKGGVSKVQELQMVTQRGKNVKVVGIKGNFDEAQTGVKQIFSDRELEEKMQKQGFRFSSANSINIGRLVPQIVYYVYSYATLLKHGRISKGEKINIVVPTGNFGNILAACYAKNMGLPVSKLICASNENKVLFDFFETGVYDRKNREFKLTSSPSMDILISSNLERLIYHIAGNDDKRTKELMRALTDGGVYEITPQMREGLKDFCAGYATEEETAFEIRQVYNDASYITDTHTAVAGAVYRKYVNATGDKETKTVIASTASPYKFAKSVMSAIDPAYGGMDDFELIDELEKISNVKTPAAVESIRNAEVLHNNVCEVSQMKGAVIDFLK